MRCALSPQLLARMPYLRLPCREDRAIALQVWETCSAVWYDHVILGFLWKVRVSALGREGHRLGWEALRGAGDGWMGDVELAENSGSQHQPSPMKCRGLR